MTSSQLRANAREALKGKWGKVALLTLVYSLIVGIASWFLNLVPVIGSIAVFVLTLPVAYGLLVSFIKIKRNEDVSYTQFLTDGFQNFGKVWSVFGNTILKMIIPVVLVVVFLMLMIFGGAGSMVGIAASSAGATAGFSGLAIIGLIGYIASLIYLVVKSYLYSITLYILYDNPEKSGKEIVEESERLMQGNRWSFFWLGLTFIGWSILASFSFGIGYLWLIPYIMVTFVCFYESLAGTKSNTVVTETVQNSESENDPIKNNDSEN